MNVKSPNNTSKWQMGFNSLFRGLMTLYSLHALKVTNQPACLLMSAERNPLHRTNSETLSQRRPSVTHTETTLEGFYLNKRDATLYISGKSSAYFQQNVRSLAGSAASYVSERRLLYHPVDM
jgi:hypothetical protein